MKIITASHRHIDPVNLFIDEVDLNDIAISLSRICRYNGHTVHHYSVAQHCVLASYLVEEKDALWALLHDAAEAYLGDIIAPVKLLVPEFSKLEEMVMEVISQRFQLKGAMPESVHTADQYLRDVEISSFFYGTNLLMPWSAEFAMNAFTQRFMELTTGQHLTEFVNNLIKQQLKSLVHYVN